MDCIVFSSAKYVPEKLRYAMSVIWLYIELDILICREYIELCCAKNRVLSVEGAMRLNFEFSEQRVGDLKKLLEETQTDSMKDLVNNAFTVLEWAVEETKAGNEIAAVNEKEQVYRVLAMPILRRVKNSERKVA